MAKYSNNEAHTEAHLTIEDVERMPINKIEVQIKQAIFTRLQTEARYTHLDLHRTLNEVALKVCDEYVSIARLICTYTTGNTI